MENTSLTSRDPARIVGYVDLALIVLEIGSFGLGFLVIWSRLNDSSRTAQNDPVVRIFEELEKNSMHTTLEYVLLIMGAILAVRLWAAVMLIQSTKPGTLVYTAWKRASCWKWTTIVLLALRIIGTLRHYESTSYWTAFFICTAIDAVFLYFVLRYVKELDGLVPTTHQTFSNEVVPPIMSGENFSKGYAQTEFAAPNVAVPYGFKV